MLGHFDEDALRDEIARKEQRAVMELSVDKATMRLIEAEAIRLERRVNELVEEHKRTCELLTITNARAVQLNADNRRLNDALGRVDDLAGQLVTALVEMLSATRNEPDNDTGIAKDMARKALAAYDAVTKGGSYGA